MILAIIALVLIQLSHPIVIQDIPKYPPKPILAPELKSEIINLKSKILLPVPFTPQAPTANWDKLHNEACEEASVVMAYEYYNNNHNSKLDAIFVEQEITKLTEYQNRTFGYHLSTNSEETAKMLTDVYNLNTKILYEFSEENIKNELAQNRLILFPANGKLLNNPNYKLPGPPYHMLVIRGYTETEIITNDPGTRKGENYSYTFETLYDANGNWNHDIEKVDTARKNIIVVWKE